MTYIVCLGEANKLLDSQWVIGVLVRMHQQREAAILLADGSLVSIVFDFKDLVGVERLEALNRANHIEVEVPNVPEEGACKKAEHESAGPRALLGLRFLLGNESLELGGFTVDALVLNVDGAIDHGSHCEEGVGEDDESEDCEGEVVES